MAAKCRDLRLMAAASTTLPPPIWLRLGHDPARMQSMARALTANDILPLVASLTPQERVRLLRLIASPQGEDAPVYRSVPPSRDEFSADGDLLAWDAGGWEDVG